MKYKVTINRMAMVSMLMNGLETFLLPMKNLIKKKDNEAAKGHEIFGYTFGTIESKKSGCINFNVEYVNFDATARTSQDSVEYNFDAKEIKIAVLKLVNPKLYWLGDIHTHPYRLIGTRIYADEFGSYMYSPSPADEECGGEKDNQLDLILAVVNAKRTLNLPTKYANNCKYCIQFDIDNLRFFIAAYVRSKALGFKYVPYANVELKMLDGIGKKAKRLMISDHLKEVLMKF